MLYFRLNADRAVTDILDRRAEPSPSSIGEELYCRHDLHKLSDAEAIALAATEFSGERYVATDAGPHCSPRYDVIKMYQVGDEVSYGFNGDVYPCGAVKSISASLKVITTTDGRRFYRRGLSGSWRDGGWCLSRGHTYKQNPSF